MQRQAVSSPVEVTRQSAPRGVPARPTALKRAMALVGVLALGGLLVLPHLGQQSLWLDESLTVGPVMAAGSAGQAVSGALQLDSQPPGIDLVLYGLRGLLPGTEFGLRLPSFVAVQIGLLLLYLTLSHLWDHRIAITAVGVAQLSPFLLYYESEARNYGVWFCLISASLFCLLRAADAWNRRRAGRMRGWILACGLVNGLALWVHLFHVFVMLGEGLCAVVFARARGTLVGEGRFARAILAAQAVAVALFVPWLVVLSAQPHLGVGWTRQFGWSQPVYCLFAALFGIALGPNLTQLHVQPISQLIAEHLFELSLAGAAMVGMVELYRRRATEAANALDRRWELLPLAVYPAATLIGPFAYAGSTDFPLHPRHLFYAWPLVPLVLALSWQREGLWGRTVVAGIVALQLVAVHNLLFNPFYAKDDHRAAIAFAEAESGPASYVLGDGLVARFYCRHAIGESKSFVDVPAGASDVWFLDNRVSADLNRRYLQRLEPVLQSLGLVAEPPEERFQGIVLRHWRAARLAQP